MTALKRLNGILSTGEVLDNSSIDPHYQFDKSIMKDTTKDGIDYCYIDAVFKAQDGDICFMISDCDSINIDSIGVDYFTETELDDIISHIENEIKTKTRR